MPMTAGSAALVHFVFFFNDTATTEIYTLSLHDALPIFSMPLVSRGFSPLLAGLDVINRRISSKHETLRYIISVPSLRRHVGCKIGFSSNSVDDKVTFLGHCLHPVGLSWYWRLSSSCVIRLGKFLLTR